jgi:prolyl-tRNA synthetase
MGGNESIEFMVASTAGEDDVAACRSCGYAANVEKATSRLEPVADEAGPEAPERFPTPGVRTIQDLAGFDGGASPDRQVKTLVYVLDGEPTLVLLRGDHDLIEQKLMDGTGAIDVRPARADEIRPLLGADAGSLGAVGVSGVQILADEALRDRRNMTTGANVDEHHLRGVDVERDITVTKWLDLRVVRQGEPCPDCGEPLEVFRAIEVGHIFKLGTVHSVALGATVQDAEGEEIPLVMGSYGIGVERNMAAVVEVNHDDKGIVWPVGIAPYEVVVTVLKMDDGPTVAAGERIYRDLAAAGIDVLIDDRDARPGVKFNDAELIGIPFRVTVGPRGLETGTVEVTERLSGDTTAVAMADVVGVVAARVLEERLAGA